MLSTSSRDRRLFLTRITTCCCSLSQATHDLIEQRLFETRTKVGAELRSVDVVGSMATAQGLTMLTSNAARPKQTKPRSQRRPLLTAEVNAWRLYRGAKRS